MDDFVLIYDCLFSILRYVPGSEYSLCINDRVWLMSLGRASIFLDYFLVFLFEDRSEGERDKGVPLPFVELAHEFHPGIK